MGFRVRFPRHIFILNLLKVFSRKMKSVSKMFLLTFLGLSAISAGTALKCLQCGNTEPFLCTADTPAKSIDCPSQSTFCTNGTSADGTMSQKQCGIATPGAQVTTTLCQNVEIPNVGKVNTCTCLTDNCNADPPAKEENGGMTIKISSFLMLAVGFIIMQQ